MNDCDSQCPFECQLLLRWGFLCRNKKYPTFVKESAILLSLIHPCRFLDVPDYLEQPWTLSYFHDQKFTYLFLANATANPSATSEVEPFQEITLTRTGYGRQVSDQYRNLGQNLMLIVALQAVEKQKEFSGATVKKFAHTFGVQTAKIVEAVKSQKEKRKILPPQLLLPLKDSKIQSFPNKNSMAQNMTGTKAGVVAEEDEVRARRKAKKELEIQTKYEAELVVLDANSFPSQTSFLSRLLSDTPLKHPVLSQPKAYYSTGQASVVVLSSDSDSDTSS